MNRILVAVLLASCLQFSQSWSIREVDSTRSKRQTSSDKRVVCYYTNWAGYRTGDSKFGPDDIHPHLCTHLIYAFAAPSPDNGLVPFDANQDIQLEGYSKFVNLKKENPDLKVILSIGGSKEGSARFSKMASSPQTRQTFATNSVGYLKQFGFDGLDFVWQYPNFTEGSSFSDKDNYVQLVKDIRDVMKDEYLLSIASPSLPSLIDRGFDLPELSKYVDFMNIINYDYHVATEPTVAHVAPLYPIPEDFDKQLNIDFTIREYIRRGVDPSKMNMGIPLYGVFWILEDPEETDFGSDAADEGSDIGNTERGSVFYNIFCKRIKEEMWTVKHANRSAVGPYAYKDKQWVSYDDEEMIKTKARYAIEKKLGGIMFWSIDMDDFKGQCHSRAFPLIKAGREAFLTNKRPDPSSTVRPRPIVTQRNPGQTNRPTTPTPTRNTPRITRPTQRPSQPLPPRQTSDVDPPDTSNDINSEPFPAISGNKTFYSNRDIVFQNVKIWISNHYYPPQ